MIEEAVLQRVLGVALRTGGDFAEVFAEERRSSAAQLDDGRVEELTSGREAGAGIRVVVGETTGFAYTADLSEPGLQRRGRRRRRGGPQWRRRRAPGRPVPGRCLVAQRGGDPARDGVEGVQGPGAAAKPTRRPGRPAGRCAR